MFFILFIGNTATTIMVIPDKVKEKVKLRYHFMSQRLSGNLKEVIFLIRFWAKTMLFDFAESWWLFEKTRVN